MRHIFTGILSFACLLYTTVATHAQQPVNFEDGFEDGDMTSAPVWSGDINNFRVTETGHPNHLMQLYTEGSGTSYIATASSKVAGYWEFYIEFRDFEPSGSNRAHLFLMSDIADLTGPVSGYAVQVGESGDDVFRLVRYDNGAEAATLLSDTTVVQAGGYTVRVSRSAAGAWALAVAPGYGGPLYEAGPSVIDTAHTDASHVGPLFEYTSSRASKFFLDFKIDLPPFKVSDATATGGRVDLTFNRPYQPDSLSTSNFFIDGGIDAPSTLSFPTPATVSLHYHTSLPAGAYTVTVNSAYDLAGNPLQETGNADFIVFGTAQPEDLVISEFMYDPPGGQAEYIELYNRSDKYLNLRNWQVADNSNAATIATDTLVLAPQSHLVISTDTTALFDTYGHRFFVSSPALPALNNSGDDIKVIMPAGITADSLHYTSGWGGENRALGRRSYSTPAHYPQNFAESTHILGGTPGMPNEVADDVSPPQLKELAIVEAQTLRLVFSERLSGAAPARASNYRLSSGITVSDAVHKTANTVRLTLQSPLQNDVAYDLSIYEAADIFGNKASQIDTTFHFYSVSEADSGEALINEFMYDPPAGSTEYIELYNTTSKSFNLRGWTLNDRTGRRYTITGERFILPPHDLAVVAADSSILTTNPAMRLAAMPGTFPSLNNDGDAIVIRDSTGLPIDSLSYDHWEGDKIALERRTVGAGPFKANFGPAPNGFGTPGEANDIESDNHPPSLSEMIIDGSNRLTLTFNEAIKPSTAQNEMHYTLAGAAGIASAAAGPANTVSLSLSSPLQNNFTYTLTVEGVEDRFGNAVVNIDTTFTYYRITPVDSGDVYINEFMYDPPTGYTEYIEIHNTSSRSLDLDGWILHDNSGTYREIAEYKTVLPPQDYIVLTPDSSIQALHPAAKIVTMGNRFPTLNNGGDAIVVRDSSGILLDSLSYTDRWNGKDVALERRTTAVPPVRANFGESPTGSGTPGAENQLPQDTVPPELTTFRVADSTSILIGFNEAVNPQSALLLSNYSLSDEAGLQTISLAGRDTFRVELHNSLLNDMEYTFVLSGIEDVFGNVLQHRDTTFTYYKISPADSGEVLITEFMYEPPAGKTEYIELYNPTRKSFNLDGWTINDHRGNRRILTGDTFTMPPKTYVVIAPDSAFAADGIAVPPHIPMGYAFPSLNNGGDDIVIRNKDGILIDSLQYTARWNETGGALERRSITVAPLRPNFGVPPGAAGSPGLPNQVLPDSTPPGLKALAIRDSLSIDVIFSELVDPTAAEDADRYSLAPGAINTAGALSPDTIRLMLSSPLQNNQSYTLTLEGIYDIFGNTAAPVDTSFTYYRISNADSGDVFINEFLAVPDEEASEYIELYNASSHTFYLKDWTVNDRSGSPTPIAKESRILPPESHIVLAAGPHLLETIPGNRLIVMGSRFPTLNNGGDAIVIRNQEGLLLDSLHYHSDWSVQKGALERRTIHVRPLKPNFAVAPNGYGSPGSSNIAGADLAPPQLRNLAIDSTMLRLSFSEQLDPEAVLDKNNYDIQPGVSINNIKQTEGAIVELRFAHPLANESLYQLTIAGLHDIFGNTASVFDTTFTFYRPAEPDSGDVFINEFRYQATGSHSEYIELYNASDKTLDLHGWTIHDRTGNPQTISSTQAILPSRSYLVLTPDSSLHLMNPGIPITVMGQRFPSLNDSGDDIVLYDSTGRRLDSLRYTATSAGAASPIERRVISAPPVESNLAPSPDSLGTPGTTNLLPQDDHPPVLNNLRVNNKYSIELVFSERLERASATADSAYILSGGSTIQTIELTGIDSVRLTLAQPLRVNTDYTLSISGISDVFGNTPDGLMDTTFTYFEILKPDSADIVITEFMYDPPEGYGEYVELYNASNEYFDLKGLTLTDQTGEGGPIPGQLISPGRYVVLAPDSSLIKDFPDITLIALGRDFPLLNNAGDAIVIRSSRQIVLDSLNYTPAWGGKQIAMERRDITAASRRPNFDPAPLPPGSPGGVNKIGKDKTAPRLRGMEITGPQTIHLLFSEQLHHDSAIDTSNFRIHEGPRITASYHPTAGQRLQLKLARPLQDATGYTLRILNQRDIFDNKSTPIDTAFTYYLPSPADSGDIFINEFRYAPSEEQIEYIELYNPTSKSLNLKDWTLSDSSGKRRNILNSRYILPPEGYVLLVPDNRLSDTYPDIPLINMSSRFPTLNNGGDRIVVRNASGLLLDSLQYNSQWEGDGVSLERRSVDVKSIWPNFGASAAGTPGYANKIEPDEAPPELSSFSIPSNRKIRFAFSEWMQPLAATNPMNYHISGNEVSSAVLLTPDTVLITLADSLRNNNRYTITLENMRDHFGNFLSKKDTALTYYTIAQPDSGTIFINEFSYDPADGVSEYIELYNPTAKSFDLEGWTISDNTGVRRPITGQSHILPPESFLVLAPDATLKTHFPKIALLPMGNRFPSLNNSGDAIVLQDSSGQRLDSLRYTSRWGGRQHALERRSIHAPPLGPNFGAVSDSLSTPGNPNGVEQDTTPPILTTLSIPDENTINLTFSEPLAPGPALAGNNIALTNNIAAEQVHLPAADHLLMQVAPALQNGRTYTITIANQQDIFGNQSVPIDTTFTFYKPVEPDSGDVFINEFCYRPGSGKTEYIELYNPTTKSFNISGWTLGDNTGKFSMITNRSIILPPDSFIVIAPEQTLRDPNPDINLIAIGSAFPSLNDGGDQIVIRDAAGRRLDSLRYTSRWLRNKPVLERRTLSVPPVRSNFGLRNHGTPGRRNSVLPDTMPPRMASFELSDPKLLVLVFSEPLHPKQARQTGNYSISGGIGIDRTQLGGADTVRLALSAPLQNNIRYTVTATNIGDLFGNAAMQWDSTFTYYRVSPADSGDVFISEFMYEPPAGNTEFVELYNRSDKSLDLQNWTLNDNTGKPQVLTGHTFILPPDSFAVIAPDSTLLEQFPGIHLLVAGNRFPALNNSGDDIVIRNEAGALLDSLRYSHRWGKPQSPVERRSFSIAASRPNFGESPLESGTPGLQNAIPPDRDPPLLENLTIRSPDTLELHFSELLPAFDFSHVQIKPARNINDILLSNDTVEVVLSQPLISEAAYQITIRSLPDIFGNVMSDTTRDLMYIHFSEARRENIVINEILYRPAPGGTPEFIEIYNKTDRNYDLSGWNVGDATNSTTIPDHIWIGGKEHLVLTGSKLVAETVDQALYLPSFPALNRNEDAVYIRNAGNIIIDSLFYTPSFGGNTEGRSAERIDPGAASNDPANFTTSTSPQGSTPGIPNAAFVPDQQPPSLLFARLTPDNRIEVRFNEFISLEAETRFHIDNKELVPVFFDPDNANTLYFEVPDNIDFNSRLILTGERISDIKKNLLETAEIEINHPPAPGALVINEIMFDPLADPEDGHPDQSEYIELRNTRKYALSLEAIGLHGAPDATGKVRYLKPIVTAQKYLPAGGTALIHADEAPTFDESKSARYFNIEDVADHRVIQVDRSSLSLNADGDAIYITWNDTVIDSVYYREEWHNPNLPATDGIALERINPDAPGNDRTNWGSSTDPRGGTPLAENSIFQKPTLTGNEDIGIRFSPNPFSPDNDGSDDRLFISYRLGHPDYLMTVHIYDRYGRLVRELADSRPAGFEGSLIWDGLRDDGRRNRIGIYIVIFKAFDSAGGASRTFKETVVLARRLN